MSMSKTLVTHITLTYEHSAMILISETLSRHQLDSLVQQP